MPTMCRFETPSPSLLRLINLATPEWWMTTRATSAPLPSAGEEKEESGARPRSARDRRGARFIPLLLLALGLVSARCMAAEATTETIRFLEARVRQDPLDSVAHNRLANVCVEQMRETGDLAWLDRAAQ